MFTLLENTFHLFKQSKVSKYFILHYLFDTILVFLKWFSYSNIIQNSNYIYLYIACKIIATQNKRIYLLFYKDKLICEMRNLFFEQQMKLYYSLSFKDNQANPIQEYREKVYEGFAAIRQNVYWGSSQFIQLFQQLIVSSYLCYHNKVLYISTILILINVCAGKLYIQQIQQENKNKLKNIKIKIKKNKTKVNILLELFQKYDIDWNFLKPFYFTETDLIRGRKKLWSGLHHAISNIRDSNLILLVLCIKDIKTHNLLILISIFSHISSTFANMVHFLGTYQQNKIEYQHLTCVFDQVSFKKKLPGLEIPNIITITKVDIENEIVHLTTNKNINIISGRNYLFQSPSGSGKTTFINALLGKIKGIELSENQPENYNWEMVVYHQDMKTNTANISIKELFELYGNCNFNDKLMKKVCNICLLNNWISSKNIDKEIKNQISGGEKKRLQLALKMYNLLSHNRKILILDEPEQGSDPEIAYQMIENIKESLQVKTILVISHLEKIREKYEWDYFLGIENNTILFSEKSIAKK